MRIYSFMIPKITTPRGKGPEAFGSRQPPLETLSRMYCITIVTMKNNLYISLRGTTFDVVLLRLLGSMPFLFKLRSLTPRELLVHNVTNVNRASGKLQLPEISAAHRDIAYGTGIMHTLFNILNHE
jgi:hypothetical protein